jgi:trigger factor
MNVETQETGAVERRLRIEIPTADVDAAFERVYRRLRQRAKIPGFRPGKAPRTVLERYFGESAQSDAFEELVRQTLGQAIEDAQLAVVTEPRLSPQGLPKQGTPFIYEANVEIRPAIELKVVRGLEVKQPTLPEPERDPVEAHLEELRMQHASVVDEEPGTAIARGHIATVHYEGTAGGEPLPGGPRRDVEVEVGAGRALPGFEDELIGLRVGDHKDVELEIPAEDARESLAGKRVALHLEVAGLKRRDLAPLDDEFVKDISQQFETLDALRTDLRARVERGREAERTRLTREALIDAVVAANPFPVPPSLVERQLQRRIQRAHQNLHGQVPEEMIARTVEEFRERWQAQAERDVRLSFLVDEIARAEKIEVTDEDYDAHLRRAASESGRSLSQLQREYREHGVADAVRGGLRDERVIDFLLAEAKLSSD